MSNYEGPPVIVEQSIAAGGQFTGALPTAPPASPDVEGVRIYPEEPGAGGGRFAWGPPFSAGTPAVQREYEFGQPKSYNVIEKIVLEMSQLGAATYTVEIVTAAGKRALWLTGGASTLVISGTNTRLYLGPDEHIELKTSGASTGKCWARVQARRLGVYGMKTS